MERSELWLSLDSPGEEGDYQGLPDLGGSYIMLDSSRAWLYVVVYFTEFWRLAVYSHCSDFWSPFSSLQFFSVEFQWGKEVHEFREKHIPTERVIMHHKVCFCLEPEITRTVEEWAYCVLHLSCAFHIRRWQLQLCFHCYYFSKPCQFTKHNFRKLPVWCNSSARVNLFKGSTWKLG